MADETKGPYRVLSSRRLYQNPWLRVREDKVIRPGGQAGSFGVVEMRAGATVLALNARHEVYLVKEYKYGIARESIELMSGAIEAGETPLAAAQRELKEELGLEASEWIDLGVIDPFTTIVHSPNYMFLARGLTEGAQQPDDGEVLEAIKLPFTTAVAMALRSEITHGASCVLLLKAAHYLQATGVAPPSPW